MGGSAADYQLRLAGQSDTRDHIRVFPDGIDGSWNICDPKSSKPRWVGGCAGSSIKSKADDVAFVEAALDWLSSRAKVDANKIYALGFSNGGVFTHRLAMESGRFAAVVAMAGSFHQGQEVPPRTSPVSLLLLHGKQDGSVPYRGGDGFAGIEFQPVEDTVAKWGAHNGCATPAELDRSVRATMIYTYTGCAGGREVILYALRDAGHGIPTNTGGDIWDLVWGFFERNAL